MLDVVIVGGSYAGLAAALQLGRARRSVVVVDGGQRRNRFAAHSHGFLGFDGVAPEAIAAAGRANVLAYPTVAVRDGRVTEIRGAAGDFTLVVGAEELRARRVILATGVVDELPAVPGLAELWGRRAFHCPYCHGYELDQAPLAVLGVHPMSAMQALHVAEWTRDGGLTLLVNGAGEPDADQTAQLAARRITVERTPVSRMREVGEGVVVELGDGRALEVAGVFLLPRTRIADPFAAQLGCQLDEGPMGPFYKTDAMKETTVPGVYACGDVGSPMPSVSFAVADGVRAGVSAHHSLVFRPH